MTRLYAPLPTAFIYPKYIKIQVVALIILSLTGQTTLAQTSLRIPEILPGQAGSDLTVTPVSFSEVGNVNGAVQTTAQSGDSGNIGIVFTISDNQTDASYLSVAASSSNQLVVLNGNLIISGADSLRTLTNTGSGKGYSDITFTDSDPDSKTDSYTIRFSVSREAIHPATTHFHTGVSDGSTAIATGDQLMWVADDEDQTLRLYHRNQSGYPLNMIDMGTIDLYGDGSEAKELSNNEWKKFASETITLGEVVFPPVAMEGDIVINEVMQNPSIVLDNSGEWFELYNNTFASVDINGWIISDTGTDIDTIDHGEPLVVPAGGYLVLGVNADLAGNGNVMVDYEYNEGFALANGADELILRASDGTLVDSIAWDGGTDWPDPVGASMSLQNPNLDNNDGSNWCVSVTAFGDGDFGTPSMDNDCALPPAYDLQITEAWVGQTTGSNLTADWFEITNFGDLAWISGTDPDLFYDDESQDPSIADLINGISEILPGKSIVVVIGNESDATVFRNVWSPDYKLDSVEIGWTNGAELGQEGDGVTLFVGTPSVGTIVDFESFPAVPSGVSWDVVLGAFSQQGVGMPQLGTNVAVATTTTNGVESAIGSPGNGGPVSTLDHDLNITEIFSGQAGTDVTADWFEIVNAGEEMWVNGTSPDLYYDDISQNPAEATLIEGISRIDTGTAAIIVIGTEEDVATFIGVWGEVIVLDGVEIGFTDGAKLEAEGDLVTVWAGDPQLYAPVDTASYPDTEADDGKSYDVSLMAFSEVGNENRAVRTLVMGGDGGDVPNIASPGNMGATTGVYITDISDFVNIFPNPGIGEFTISISEGHTLLNSTVYDITGQKIFFRDYHGSEFTTKIDLKSLERGIYLLRLHMEQGIAVKRIIKE